MLKFCKKCKGAISVFLTLILLPTFIFGGVIVDGSRVLGAKNIVAGAGDLAMNAALSNYNEELNETYGLLAMAKTPEEVEDVLEDFFETSLNAAGVDREDFNKALIYLELTDDFSSVSVPESEIYRTEVIRQEILEYMKFRAPVTLIDRAITDRLGDLEYIKEEKEAVDGQIKFEKEMDDFQEKLDEIKSYTDRLEVLHGLVKDEDQQNEMLELASDNYDEIAWLTVAYKRMQTCSDKEEGATIDLMKKMCESDLDPSNITPENAELIIEKIKIQNGMSGKNKYDILEGLDPLSDEYNDNQKLIENYDSALANIADGIANTEKKLQELVKTVHNLVNRQREGAIEGEEICEKLVGKDGEGGLIRGLEDKLEELQILYNEWETAVNKLPEDSETKSEYQESMDKVKGFFEVEGGIGEYKENVKNNKIFYHEVWTQLDMVTFTGKKVATEIKEYDDFYNVAPADYVNTAGEIESKGREFKSNYHNIVMVLSVENRELDTPSAEDFVSIMNDFCKKSDGDAAKKEQYTKELDAKMKENDSIGDEKMTLSEFFASTDVLEGEDKPNVDTMGGGELPSNWLNLRSVTDADTNNGEKSKAPEIEGGLNNSEDREKASGSGSDGLNEEGDSISSMSSLASDLSGLENGLKGLGVGIAEKLYITEYVLGMFSYYTCDKDEKGNEIEEPETINGKSLKDNALYRAEVEYILWGDPDVRDNVGKTKAVIFAANLVFNMSFAFTNLTIKTDARTIALCFPVAPPAQIAIKCAIQSMVAMVETVKNVVDICEGKRIPLIKNRDCWTTWLIQPGIQKYESAYGFTYEDYLWVFMCMNMLHDSQNTKILARTADCIELNLTDKKSDEDNTLKSMFTMVQIEADVTVDTYFLDRLNGAGYDVQKVDKETFKIPYTGIQGY